MNKFEINVKAGLLSEIATTQGDEKLGYWSENELNLCKALLLYIANNPELKGKGKDTFNQVCAMLTTNSVDEMKRMFSSLNPEDPAKQAFDLYAQCDPKIQGQIANGLGIRLQEYRRRQLMAEAF